MTLQELLTELAKLGGVAGASIGGMWAWYRYLRSRTYHDRLELTVSARPVEIDPAQGLLVEATLTNRGAGVLQIDHEGSGILLQALEQPHADAGRPYAAQWENLAAFDLVSDNAWMESGETTRRQELFVLPQCAPPTWRTEVVAVSSRRSRWTASCLVHIARPVSEGSSPTYEIPATARPPSQPTYERSNHDGPTARREGSNQATPESRN